MQHPRPARRQAPGCGWRTRHPRSSCPTSRRSWPARRRCVGTLPRRGVVRVVVDELAEPWTYRIDVSCRDRPGLLARLTDALAGAELDIVAASLTTWPDGGVLDSFVVRGSDRPDPGLLTERMERRLRGKIDVVPLADVDVAFDDTVFPWHTQCIVRGRDRRGLLAAIAAAFDAAKVDVHAASVGTDDVSGTSSRTASRSRTATVASSATRHASCRPRRLRPRTLTHAQINTLETSRRFSRNETFVPVAAERRIGRRAVRAEVADGTVGHIGAGRPSRGGGGPRRARSTCCGW